LLINDDKNNNNNNNNKDESLEVLNEEDEEKFTLTFPTNTFDQFIFLIYYPLLLIIELFPDHK
jgi:hypothetical protein